MGAVPSKQDSTSPATEPIDKVDLGNTLAKKLSEATPDPKAPTPDAKRQETLDSAIQDKIHEELSKLRKQEQEMQKKIELALEKENIERQGKPWFGNDKGQSSELLQQELDRVKSQIEKYYKRDLNSFPSLKEARDKVIACYRADNNRTLDCWREVDAFKQAIKGAEKELMAAWNDAHEGTWLDAEEQ
ncbi:uncharacterized protein MJAP1_003699 [Malassezia japonica]|uniref:MICOS complex subunit mic19 n=1 Tax=Malassezia japonica TaxID=223818 RepID=A0AAF0JHC1_9BASI|nr:uncharacterized protein MJAP1_003699 [Malassezia japonica]WFD40711.1 hypothetical protein MJAP1_003699 [Malassezia japonica]